MPMPSARKAATSAEVQEFTASACGTPMNSAEELLRLGDLARLRAVVAEEVRPAQVLLAGEDRADFPAAFGRNLPEVNQLLKLFAAEFRKDDGASLYFPLNAEAEVGRRSEVGYPAWIRTTIRRTKTSCATIAPPGSVRRRSDEARVYQRPPHVSTNGGAGAVFSGVQVIGRSAITCRRCFDVRSQRQGLCGVHLRFRK